MAGLMTSCVALCWDAAGVAAGVRLAREGGAVRIEATAKDAGSQPLGERLATLARSLNPNGQLPMVAGGYLAGLYCTEFKLPTRRLAGADMRLALEQELPLHFPCSLSELAWSWRVVDDQAGAGPCRIRVVAIPLETWQQLLHEFSTHGVTVDAVLPPWICPDPLLAGLDVALPVTDPEATLLAPGIDGCRCLEPQLDAAAIPSADQILQLADSAKSGALQEPFLTGLLLGGYALSDRWFADRDGRLSLPEAMRPRRHLALKRLTTLAALLAAALTLTYGARLYADGWAHLRDLQQARGTLAGRQLELQKKITRYAAQDLLIGQIDTLQAQSPDLLVLLANLAETLPDGASVSDLTASDGKADVVLRSQGDFGDDALAGIARNPRLRVDKVLKRRGNDGATTLSFSVFFTDGATAEAL